jgi:hypothetical protein
MISNVSDFISYLKLRMGAPVTNIEIDDTQFVQIIEDSIQTFHRYTYGESTYRDALTINLSANVSAYQLTSAIDSVVDIKLSTNNGSINELFTAQHNFLYPQFQNGTIVAGTGQGLAGPRTLGGMNTLSEYNISMIYLKEISDFFEKKYTCQFSPNTYQLRVWPTPEVDCVAMLIVWKKEQAQSLYNNYHVKNLALAKSLIQLGTHLGRYNINLPGGGTINYQIYLDRGIAMEEKTINDMQMESFPVQFEVG